MTCTACREEAARWLDYRPARTVRIAAGAAYDDTAAGVADNRRVRFEAWRTLVREQRARIYAECDHVSKVDR